MRCQTSKRTCHGYVAETERQFRDQNDLAKRHALQDQPHRHQRGDTSLIHAPFDIDLDEAVLARFSHLSVFTDTSGHCQEGLLSILESVYANAFTSSPAIPATLAMAWATCAPFCPVSHRMYVARRKYGEALVSLQDALRDPYLAKEDGTLFAVLLMGWIEVRQLFASGE